MNKIKKDGTPRLLIVVTIAAMSLMPTVAQAQSSSDARSSSSSSAQVDSAAQASASGGNSNAQIYLDQRASETSRVRHNYSGSYTVRSAPSVQPPSMGSGHPCAIGGSIGISLIGGGAAGGLSRVDEACLLAQMGQGQAALIMIARRDPAACSALRQVGSIPPGSICSPDERRAARSAQRRQAQVANFVPGRPAPAMAQYVRCMRDAQGRLIARKRPGTPFGDDQIAQFCRDRQ